MTATPTPTRYKHLYAVAIRKGMTEQTVDIEANNRDQAARKAIKQLGADEVLWVNMVG